MPDEESLGSLEIATRLFLPQGTPPLRFAQGRSDGSYYKVDLELRTYWVYIMSSKTRTIHVGVTNDLERRVLEHKSKQAAGFTKKYAATRLVYYEEFDSVYEAIEREKQIKAWRRPKKVELVNSLNPNWSDFAEDWIE